MKRFCLVTTTLFCIITISVFACIAKAEKLPISGLIQPISDEYISILVGDKASINLGTKDGLIKGDIGIVRATLDKNPEKDIGKCVVTRTEFGTSICELIVGKKEIEKGNSIFFDRIEYSDPFIYSLVMTTLAHTVEPYEPYDDLRVCIYGVFDKSNSVTGLSQQMLDEFNKIFPQKKRIKLISKDVFPSLVIYPSISSDIEAYLKTQMKRVNVDVLILAKYEIQDERVKVNVESIHVKNKGTSTTYVFPFNDKYQKTNSIVLLTPGEATKARNIPCKLALKNIPKVLLREDKIVLLRSESNGNAVIENALKRIDFNMVNPVEVIAVIDGESIDISDTRYHSIMLSTGNHSVSLAFKKGFFYNETLLYTSEKIFQKEVVISLSKPSEVVIEVLINSLDTRDPISLSVFHPVERQKQVLLPISRVEFERTIETYKD